MNEPYTFFTYRLTWREMRRMIYPSGVELTVHALFYTVFPRIVVHAPVYETEAMVHAPKVSPNCTFFYFEKIGPFRI